MKHKVSELTGALLDSAVAKLEANDCAWDAKSGPPPYSTSWGLAGPIIEREWIAVYFDTGWIAGFDLCIDHWDYGGETGSGSSLELHYSASGQTPLIAAMRAYVTSKFGEEVELP